MGFSAWGGWFSGALNPVGWFIELIVILYFLYPFLSASIRKYPYLMLFLIAVVEIVTRSYVNIIGVPALGIWPDKWLPMCNLLEFCLGVWVVQQGFYPKWTYDNAVVFFLAEISFYVFLIHEIGGIMTLATISLPIYIAVFGLIAWFMMLGDQRIQVWLKKRILI
jgi:hypothetical protein